MDTEAASDLLAVSTAWMDELWDGDAALVRYPPDPRLHGVLQTVFYAVGLLLRAGPGDAARAARAVDAALAHQYDARGTVFHGTFRRFPTEPQPPAAPRVWVDYDPNWRQFTGTALALVLDGPGADLPSALRERIGEAIALCVDGEPPDRVPAWYANIALMRSWLDAWEGRRRGDAALVERGEALARAVHHRFALHEAFDEYNSPTYYGVDLYALALWRTRAPTPAFEDAAGEIEPALWRDVARFYHAGLRNLCGPYSRAYGMDMRRYAALLGMWVWAAVGRDHAPFPDPSRPFGHSADLAWGPLAVMLPPAVPDDVMPDLATFSEPRSVRRRVPGEPSRTASAHLDDRWMLGGADASGAIGWWEQYHPATAHWLTSDGDIGWMRLRHPGPADANVDGDAIEIRCLPGADEPTVFELSAPGIHHSHVEPGRWTLPGMRFVVEADVDPVVEAAGTERLHVRYPRPDPDRPRTFVLTVRRADPAQRRRG